MASSPILPRHNSMDVNRTDAILEPHWGYATRKLPCINDAATCAYLDACYRGHDISMLYTFILWAVLLSLALTFLLLRTWTTTIHPHRTLSLLDHTLLSLKYLHRKLLLPDSPFRHISRLQILLLSLLLIHLSLLTFLSNTYQTWWRIPTPGTPYTKTRTGFGPFADRIGALAYALTPLSILLATRESLLSLITGIPYQHFGFLHKWLGRVIYVQATVHTIAWTLVEGYFYEPQPETWNVWVKQLYAGFGIVAMVLLTVMVVLSLGRVVRWTGYAFFKVTHSVLAVAYVGACWGHWDQLWCWMVAGLALIVLDYLLRGFRILYLHLRGTKADFGFKPAQANLEIHGSQEIEGGAVLRLDFDHFHRSPWKPGQHFFLTFPSISIWQAHPFTPASLPLWSSHSVQHHTYVVRVRNGITSKLAAIDSSAGLPVILTGPYGNSFPEQNKDTDLLLIAGGTGISFTLPILREVIEHDLDTSRMIQFVWIVRHSRDLLWLQDDLYAIQSALKSQANSKIDVKIFLTRESAESSVIGETKTMLDNSEGVSSEQKASYEMKETLDCLMTSASGYEVVHLNDHHPDLQTLVQAFSDSVKKSGSASSNVQILGSGPPGMDSDFRLAVSRSTTDRVVSSYFDSRS